MGKAYKWIRSLLGMKNSDPDWKELRLKKIWSFSVSRKGKESHGAQKVVVNNNTAVAESRVNDIGSGKSTSAVAYVSKSGAGYGRREVRAAVMIQSHFRAYLSRRALRALKALVKLQALTRGYLVRKQTADVFRRMHALLRAQTRARAGRSLISESPYSSKKSSGFHPGPSTPEKFEPIIRTRNMKHELIMLQRNRSKSSGSIAYDKKVHMNRDQMGSRMGENSLGQCQSTRDVLVDDESTDKIIEAHVVKPHATTKRRSFFHTAELSTCSDKSCHSVSMSKDSTARQAASSPTSKVQALSPLEYSENADDSVFCTADNSPQVHSTSSMGGSLKREMFTPSRSDGARSCLSGFSDHPNYMSYTESSKAKARSHSAPKQRQYDRSTSSKRYSAHGCNNTQRVSTLHANFTNRVYPGSGRLDRIGMPVRGYFNGFSCSHHR